MAVEVALIRATSARRAGRVLLSRLPSFGECAVLSAESSGAHTRLQVNFEGASSKWLVATFANLTPL